MLRVRNPTTRVLTNASQGLRKNIRLELSDGTHEPGTSVGNATTVTLADAGTLTALQDFDSMSSQAGLIGFDEGVPFELLTGVAQDNSTSSVTLIGDSGTNSSVMASA